MKTVFCIDDDLNSLKLIQEQIKFINPDIKLITENKSENAMELFINNSNTIDLVFLDVQIPSINGYDLLILMKKAKPRIPVIMITASTGNREYDYVIKKLGASEYLVKPLLKDRLIEVLDKYLI